MKLTFIDHIPDQLADAELWAIETNDGLLLTAHAAPGATPLTVQAVPYETDFHARNQGLIDPGALQEKTVTIIGLGSGGSPTALDLVRAGVTKQIWIEPDTAEVANICRSPYDLADMGRLKIDALAEKAARINPHIEIERRAENYLEIPHEELHDIIKRSAVIIDATDNINTKRLTNGLAHHSTPVLYPGVYPGGMGGDILLTQPGTPCMECVFNSILPQMEALSHGEWDYATDEKKPMSGLIADIAVIAARTTKLTLAILLEGTEHAFLDKIKPADAQMLFIANQGGFFIFDEPSFNETWATTEINPDCTCQQDQS